MFPPTSRSELTRADDNIGLTVTAVVESLAAIVCACAPTYGIFLTNIYRAATGSRASIEEGRHILKTTYIEMTASTESKLNAETGIEGAGPVAWNPNESHVWTKPASSMPQSQRTLVSERAL